MNILKRAESAIDGAGEVLADTKTVVNAAVIIGIVALAVGIVALAVAVRK